LGGLADPVAPTGSQVDLCSHFNHPDLDIPTLGTDPVAIVVAQKGSTTPKARPFFAWILGTDEGVEVIVELGSVVTHDQLGKTTRSYRKHHAESFGADLVKNYKGLLILFSFFWFFNIHFCLI